MPDDSSVDQPRYLRTHPLHLGLGATAVPQPEFTGQMEWYGDYGARHGGDGAEGRLVTMHSFDGAWDVWEMHPNGSEVVVCVEGRMEFVQEVDGEQVTVEITAGQYLINAPGVWHTANDAGPATALFITAGEGTQHRSREV